MNTSNLTKCRMKTINLYIFLVTIQTMNNLSYSLYIIIIIIVLLYIFFILYYIRKIVVNDLHFMYVAVVVIVFNVQYSNQPL